MPSSPTDPGILEASTGTPAITASEITLAPPSMTELRTMTGASANARRTRQCGTSPAQRYRVFSTISARARWVHRAS
ncbi:MAG: hypothetical protein JO122_07480 [Acetobacteraceae bacterium]|nr:hypothetical protein [Acetobacteraceae bacterium]